MKKIFVLLLLIGVAFAYSKVLVVDFKIDKWDNIKSLALSVVNGSETWCGTDGPYEIQLLDKEGNILKSRNFSISFILYTDPPRSLDESGVSCDLEFDITRAESLVIKHDGKIIHSEDIKDKFCNNDLTCNNYENIVSCPKDCNASSEDGYCTGLSDGICDPDCASVHDPDCPESKDCMDGVCYSSLNDSETSVPTSHDKNSTSSCLCTSLLLILLTLVFYAERALKNARGEI